MKKQNILLVLKILESESDKSHPMTQGKLADIISAVYPCDRKTVGRNIGFLKNMGYPIVKTSRGFYLDDKLFTVDERAIILSAVHSAVGEAELQKTNLLDRLTFVLDRFIDKNSTMR